MHQSARNSGVVHAGIYYTPGSLKASMCVAGSRLLYDYCNQAGIPVQKVGKLIVASDESEIPALEQLHERGKANGISDLRLVDEYEAREIQPGVRCTQALWSPSTGITDYASIAKAFAAESAAQVFPQFRVNSFSFDETRRLLVLTSETGCQVKGKVAVTTAGLFADKVSVLTGNDKMPAIVPFRGEYLLMKPCTQHGIRTNVYPVPDPRFPFLGVHLTPRLDGSVLIGPNAVPALSREGYSWFDVSVKETWESVTHPGFQSLALKYSRHGLEEIRRSIFVRRQLQHVRRLMPGIRAQDVTRGPTGVRAQALDASGSLVEDFVFQSGAGHLETRVLHVRNAPSPAATSSLAIAAAVCDHLHRLFSHHDML